MRISDWSSDVCSSDLLDRKDKRPERPDFKQDGKGKTLIPGLIDAHGHVMGLGFKLMLLDLSGTGSLAEAQAAIRKYAAERSEARRVGKEGGSTCRSRRSAEHKKKQKNNTQRNN